MVNLNQQRVHEFHKRMAAPAPSWPTKLADNRINLRLCLIAEETEELADALEAGDMLEAIDALCDLLYVTYGCAVEMGIDLEPFFAEVHRSNMTKAPGVQRSDGKILGKGEGYEPPDLKAVFDRRYGRD